MSLVISTKVRRKLAGKNPPVTEDEIHQCFANRTGTYLTDEREQHKTNPPTLWFIAETDYGRKLKIVFVTENDDQHLRTAYDPNPEEIRIFQKYS